MPVRPDLLTMSVSYVESVDTSSLYDVAPVEVFHENCVRTATFTAPFTGAVMTGAAGGDAAVETCRKNREAASTTAIDFMVLPSVDNSCV